MRLRAFILENNDIILKQWEDFARKVWPDVSPSVPDLRDHAQEMLLAIANDMQTEQSEEEQHEKSVGEGDHTKASATIDSVSARHAEDRLESGFDVRALVAEYRALRASVIHLWNEAVPDMRATQIQDITRFNECVDQLLAESILSYSNSVDHSRELLLGILGHDLRSPLCAVSMMSGLLEKAEDLSDSSRQMASLIVVSSREMTRLVADLLDFAGAHLGVKMQVQRESMNLEELCREVIEEIRATHKSRVYNLECSGDVNGEWDRQRLRQLISNLLANAVQHGAAQTAIRVFIKSEGQEVILGVCNQGSPIPRSLQAVMFDPLRYSSTNGLSRELGGFGLGLYIAQEVAKGHGGVITVSSDKTETAFIVKLPRRNIAQKKRRTVKRAAHQLSMSDQVS